MKFTVETKNWLRGEDSNHSRLLRPRDGKMCCLGFLSLACGIAPQDIKGQVSIGTLGKHLKGLLPEVLFQRDSDFGLKTTPRNYFSIESVNDNPALSEAERQKRLLELFRYIGIEVNFV